ncbi:MAG: 4-(cytidine 5'-diphospho)-2-C-methyl-D-erythritol kinase [Eubacterium sp.]|nr:4-(cytidine 5'-diphospho)-2-C-methyl-D-erythritol kinase [Eubacterium sp.]
MDIQLKSYAKINLSLDVKGVTEDGMHLVEMVMQQILLCDDIAMRWTPGETEGLEINLKTNRSFLPTDERNLAYKATLVMEDLSGKNIAGTLDLNIKKRIPVAAGLAGGSGNGAAVLHGLNVLWGMDLDLKELCEAGAKLGSDVPFCVMGQAAENEVLKERFAGHPLACHCALATGTGTDLAPLKGLKSHIVLSKPPISVSTAKAYQGIDNIEIKERPDTQELIDGLKTRDLPRIEKNMVNVLENYTLMEYPTVVYTKNKMRQLCGGRAVLMSGSGPSVYGLTDSIRQSRSICEEMSKINRESFWTRTTY